MPDVRWYDDSRRTTDVLREHVAAVWDVEPATVTTGHLCARCGASAHGRPWARLSTGDDVPVSASHAGGHLVTAVGGHGAIGIDIEVITDVDRAFDPSLVLADDEYADTPAERAALWCGKEAVLKATGRGLDAPMTGVRLADWDVRTLPAPQGMWASLAVVDPLRPGGAGAAAPGPATA
ncbi:4'-phosphopantetheinyl transferase family protein [Epidermidibacterium keratini]|nr:4'-phosphopantetheinyl transferase superfamily protein [Epidermidibacterium keratini]